MNQQVDIPTILWLLDKGKSPEQISYMSGVQTDLVKKLLSRFAHESFVEDLQIDIESK